MPRKRVRDWMQIVYKYAVVHAEIPEGMWQQARKMQDLWNHLAREHQKRRELISAEGLDDTARSALWARWRDVDSLEIAKSYELRQESDVDILDRFNKACAACGSDPKRGWPRPGGFKVSIRHRFTGGGRPVANLCSTRCANVRVSSRLDFDGTDKQLVCGTFRLNNDDQIRFRAVIHRPIPPGCIVKQFRWLGRYSKAFGWSWAIAVTVEVPPGPERRRTGKVAALDVGWRRRGDALRVAYLVDSCGYQEEILLPLDFSTHDSRKQRLKYPQWNHIPETHEELRALAGRRDKHFDETKAQVAALLSQELTPPGFDKMRSRGLLNMLHPETGLPAAHPARAVIELWRTADRPHLRTFARASERFARHRQDVYRRVALRLASEYDEIGVEKVEIKEMIKTSDKSAALQAADRNHQIAATADFLLHLAAACRKTGSKYQLLVAADSTQTCCICGGVVAHTSNLLATCVNGHELDQDENAARNLIKADWPKYVKKRTTRKEFFAELVRKKQERQARDVPQS